MRHTRALVGLGLLICLLGWAGTGEMLFRAFFHAAEGESGVEPFQVEQGTVKAVTSGPPYHVLAPNAGVAGGAYVLTNVGAFMLGWTFGIEFEFEDEATHGVSIDFDLLDVRPGDLPFVAEVTDTGGIDLVRIDVPGKTEALGMTFDPYAVNLVSYHVTITLTPNGGGLVITTVQGTDGSYFFTQKSIPGGYRPAASFRLEHTGRMVDTLTIDNVYVQEF